jgi:hypothetical protein
MNRGLEKADRFGSAPSTRRNPATAPNLQPYVRRSGNLIEKIRSLPPDKLVEVEDFVDFLR